MHPSCTGAAVSRFPCLHVCCYCVTSTLATASHAPPSPPCARPLALALYSTLVQLWCHAGHDWLENVALVSVQSNDD